MHAGNIGIERQDSGVVFFYEDVEFAVWPVEAQVSQKDTEQHDIAHVTATDDENALWLFGHFG